MYENYGMYEMKETDSIDVLICVHSKTYKHDFLLNKALESLTRQTFKNFKVIIVMDECWEHTMHYVNIFQKKLTIEVHERKKKEGLAKAKNFGLSKCTADWVAYLDADDQWMDCKLEIQRSFMIKNPDIDFCFTGAWDFDGVSLRPNCFAIGQYDSHQQISDRLPNENCLCHGSAIIKVSSLYRLGGYRTNVTGIEDYDLWMRAVLSGYKFAKVPERLYIYSMGTSVER